MSLINHQLMDTNKDSILRTTESKKIHKLLELNNYKLLKSILVLLLINPPLHLFKLKIKLKKKIK